MQAGDLEGVEAGLDAVSAMIAESADLRRFLGSPVISGDDRVAAVAALVDKGLASGLAANFLQLVARNRRLFALGAMIAGFKDLSADARGEMRAEVISATALTDKQTGALAAELKRKIGKSVSLDLSVDPSLIGGLIVKVGSRMIDSSLKTKLAAMRFAMKEVR